MQDKRVKDALAELKNGENLYVAGHPEYASNFSRDSFIYATLAQDFDALKAQVEYSSRFQGSAANPEDGAEPGKIHHELPPMLINGLHATYSGCDTTAYYLMAICRLAKHVGNHELLKTYKNHINAAVDYIKSHVHENLFWEDPAQAGNDRFALKVTYWKDSEMNREDSNPHYPIVYSLAHFQNARALQSIGELLEDQALTSMADNMYKSGLDLLWYKDHFITAVERGGKSFDPPSTDSMHCLLYIDSDSIDSTHAQKIETYSEPLITKAGYRTGIPQPGNTDAYHTNFVWVHEQALLNAAAQNHGLDKAEAISARIQPYMEAEFPELLDVKDFKPAGNSPQLWVIGAYLYFKRGANPDLF